MLSSSRLKVISVDSFSGGMPTVLIHDIPHDLLPNPPPSFYRTGSRLRHSITQHNTTQHVLYNSTLTPASHRRWSTLELFEFVHHGLLSTLRLLLLVPHSFGEP